MPGRREKIRRSLRLVMTSALVLTVIPVLLVLGLYSVGGYVKTPSQWWYPFITSFLSDYYTTGPFAMTSNTREDNPIWLELPAFNKSLARLTYAMSRGQPQAEVAWLLADAQWPDEPALERGLAPNRGESTISRALVQAGLNYDRISRKDLIGATARDKVLLVGKASYKALLIDGLEVAEPDLLESVLTLARQGVPVIWQGSLPVRAPGWARWEAKDKAVQALAVELHKVIHRRANESDVVAEIAESGVIGVLQTEGPGGMELRINHRELDIGELILLFNETGQTISRTFRTTLPYRHIKLLDPETGYRETLDVSAGQFSIDVPAYRTRLLLLERQRPVLQEWQAVRQVEAKYEHGQQGQAAWDWSLWQNPPRSMHPYIRWWWPGNAVEKSELRAELLSIHAAGYGGVELQTLTIGLSSSHLVEHQDRIYKVGTDGYFENLKTVFELANELGIAVDLTLGSGWSSGGPFIDRFPEQQLLRSSIDVSGPAHIEIKLPQAHEPWYVMPTNWIIRNTVGEFDRDVRLHAVVAARLDDNSIPPTLSDPVDVSTLVAGDTLGWEVPEGDYRIYAFYQNNTAHNVAASAYAGGLAHSTVLDHLNSGGAAEYIQELGKPWLDSIKPYRPGAVFIDSFELVGELPWSRGFDHAFLEMHGYDLTPYLPLVFRKRGESKYVNVVLPVEPAYQSIEDMAERIREDYESTREKLFEENFLKRMKNWTKSEGVKLRVQAHGGYGDYLDSYKIADIPEAEGLFAGGTYEFLKLAASAGHVAGRRIISSESFISMTTDFNALAIDDYYLLAGNAYAAGINRTICHGYAYHYPVH